jgi:sugar phosphate isomerase/epimerase
MLDRRSFLAGASAALISSTATARVAPPARDRSLGVVIHSYPIRSRIERTKGFTEPATFLAFCRDRGAAGVQLPLGIRTASEAAKLRAQVERFGMYLEGSVRPPKDRSDVERFSAEIRTARDAGALVVRTVMLVGRRYETFRTARAYADFARNALASLHLAEPIVSRFKVTLAVENHKDYRADELADVMKRLSSEYVGVCVDTGNNLALLEQPLETAKALAPWAAACHLKDMAVEEGRDGFHLAEVPLGDGLLDLKGILAVLRKARPAIRFSLEMITRDPLHVPCLADGYWATFDKVPGRDLARTLALVRARAAKTPLPRISRLSQAKQLEVEDQNVRRSIAYGRDRLGL